MAEGQRRRILEATAELVGENGYLDFKVEELLSRAHVSLSIVRRRFGDKRGCYLALLDHGAEEAKRRGAEAFAGSEGTWVEKAATTIGALLELMAAHPDAARACLIEPFAAGPTAIERYEGALGELAAVLRSGRGGNDGVPPPPPEAMVEGLVAGVLWLASGCLLEGKPEQIAELAPEAMELIRNACVKREEPGKWRGTDAGGTTRTRRAPEPGGQGSAGGGAEPALGPLPAGRHGLPREVIERSQWERLVAAMAGVAARKGYATVTLGDIVGEAKVSRRVFYENFGSKEQCFLSAWDTVAEHLQEVVGEGAAVQAGDPPRQVIGALGAILGFLAAEPELARFCLVEGLAAGRLAMRRYRGAVDRAAAALRASLGTPPFEGSAAGAIEEALAGALATILSLRIAREGAERLPAMLPELSAFLLGPYIGHTEADRIAREVALGTSP